MVGALVDQLVVTELLKRRIPLLMEHFKRCNFDPGMLTLQWFTCLFSYNFNAEIIVRLWDVFIIKGAKILFRISLAIFHLLTQSLLQQSDT